MKKIFIILFILSLSLGLIAQTPHPSLDGRAIVSPRGTYPSGFYGRAPGFLPGDTVIVTSYTTGFSIEVFILSGLDTSTGIAIELSEEAAKALDISRDTDSYVKIQKKSAFQKEIINTPAPQSFESQSLDPDKNPSLALAQTEEIQEYINGIKDSYIKEKSFPEIIDESEFIESDYIANDFDEYEEESSDFESFVFNTDEFDKTILEDEPVLEILADFEDEEVEEDAYSIFDDAVEVAEKTEDMDYDELEDLEYEEIAYSIFDDAEEVAVEVEDELFPEDFIEVAILEETEPQYPEDIEEAKSIFDEIISQIDFEEDETMFEEELSFIELASIFDDSFTEITEVAEIEEVELFDIESNAKDFITRLENLKKDAYYIQIASVKQESSLDSILTTYSENYPMQVLEANGFYQIVVGPFSDDEYKVILERFKQRSFSDAFVRLIK